MTAQMARKTYQIEKEILLFTGIAMTYQPLDLPSLAGDEKVRQVLETTPGQRDGEGGGEKICASIFMLA
jgi:hypothetical protein